MVGLRRPGCRVVSAQADAWRSAPKKADFNRRYPVHNSACQPIMNHSPWPPIQAGQRHHNRPLPDLTSTLRKKVTHTPLQPSNPSDLLLSAEQIILEASENCRKNQD